MKVLVAGANGKVGTILCGKLWSAHDFSPVALIRDSRQQTKFTALGVPAVLGDLEEGIADFLPGLDAVVFTAGSGARTGPEKTVDVDQDAAMRLIDDCVASGVRRFLMVSAIGADPNSESDHIGHYFRAKGVADAHLRASRLDYTVFAPGHLTDDVRTGCIEVAENLGCHGTISREDVADAIIECLRNYLTIGKTIQAVAGDTKVKEAIAEFVGGGDQPPIA